MVYRPKLPLISEAYLYAPHRGSDRYPFYLTSVGHFKCGEDFITRRDERNDYQLIHTLSGEGYLLIDGVYSLLHPGSFALIDCMHLHEYGTRADEWEYEYIHFTGEGMKVYLERVLQVPLILYPHNAIMLKVYFDEMTKMPFRQSEEVYAHDCAAIATCLSALINPGPPDMDKTEQHYESEREFQAVLRYIHTHFCEKISLDDLLKVSFLSKYYFCHKFKVVTGVTPYQYILKLRIERANELMRYHKLPISSIAQHVGFTGSSEFIRQYKKITGTTPGEYQKQFSDYPNSQN